MICDAARIRLPITQGDFTLDVFVDPKDAKEHLVLSLGEIKEQENVLLRIHSECLTGDVFGSLRCDCGKQLKNALDHIAEEGQGILIYLRQEGRGIGLLEKLKAYQLQEQGHDTVEANILLGHQADERDYGIVPHMLNKLGVKSVRLITNNPAKLNALLASNILVNERIDSPLHVNKENMAYLKTKATKLRHIMSFDEVCCAD